MEEVRKEEYPFYPSRMSCLYVSRTYEEAERWGEFLLVSADQHIQLLNWK